MTTADMNAADVNAPAPALADCAESYDVIIIGAGPAGLSAATVTAGNGLSTLVVDENAGPGGQIWRAIGSTPLRAATVLGEDYWRGASIADRARASGATFLTGATVWSLDAARRVGITQGGSARLIAAQRVIIATGAQERPCPAPGWTLPGVMTIGAAQTLLKTSGLVPSGNTIIAGSGPLLWLYAAQALRAGGSIAAILDTTPPANIRTALPHLPTFLASPYALKGLALVREVHAKVRVVTGVTKLEATGKAALTGVRCTAKGKTHEWPAETLLLHQGVVPQVNLAMAAGVPHRWNAAQNCFAPVVTDTGATALEGIAIAGDGAGIAGADIAVARGELAAIDAVRALKPDTTLDDAAARGVLRRYGRGRAFLDAMFAPARSALLPADDVIVCRCEEVTAGQVRAAARLGCIGPNQMKAFSRCGMGPCQGRLCGLTVTALIGEVHGKSPDEVGYYRLRTPVKPITLAEFATIPPDAAATKAVVRY